MRLSVIGVGTMGAGIANALASGGHDVVVFDLDERRAAAAGSRAATSPAEAAAQSDVAFLALPGGAEVEEAVLPPGSGLLHSLGSGAVVINTSTTSLDSVERTAAACRAVGVEFLDAPVSGRPPTMTMLVGGDREVLRRVQPVLDQICGAVFHMGPTGAGCVSKLLSQFVGYTNFVTTAYAYRMGLQAGLNGDTLISALGSTVAKSAVLDMVRDGARNENLVRYGRVELIAKDLRLVTELAARLGTESTLTIKAADVFQAALRDGLGAEPFPIVVRRLIE
jgi:3-hydroxyisobutyrate dehydrogenase-like beta-hydroxyacid dehydrogenase